MCARRCGSCASGRFARSFLRRRRHWVSTAPSRLASAADHLHTDAVEHERDSVRAWRIVDANRYLTLATETSEGPWAAPVAYVLDGRRRFVWASRRDARHSVAVDSSRRAALAVFDSSADYSAVDGVQAEGDAGLISSGEIADVLGLFVARFPMYSDLPADLFTTGPFGLYRMTPTAIYVLDKHSEEGDRRIQIPL